MIPPPVLIRAVTARAIRLGGAGVDMPALIEGEGGRSGFARCLRDLVDYRYCKHLKSH